MHCPEIHGESGLDSLAGGSLLTSSIATTGRQYARAVPRMFEVISQHFASRWEAGPLTAIQGHLQNGNAMCSKIRESHTALCAAE